MKRSMVFIMRHAMLALAILLLVTAGGRTATYYVRQSGDDRAGGRRL